MHFWRVVLGTIIVWSLLLVVGGLVYVFSGSYDIGADAHHTRLVSHLLGHLRERSIAVRSADIAVPDLTDPQRIAEGAEHYDAMCTGCHLRPGLADTELREGLYPRPPNLTRFSPEPRAAFWVIKHGIKMSAMPAWGLSHDDDKIWAMVAFLQKLPHLTPAQYQAMLPVAGGADHGHAHDHDADGGHEHMDDDHGAPMPSTQPAQDDQAPPPERAQQG